MADPLRLGIIGCGGISHRHGAAALALQERLRFVACCDVRRNAADAWAAKFGADRVYTDYETMIAEEQPDGVLLATWPALHREQIEGALAAGAKNLICEKALTITGLEALEIRELVTEAGAVLLEGYMYRHHPATHAFERLIRSGAIGELDSVRVVFSHNSVTKAPAANAPRNWRQRREMGGGVPHDWVCYAVNGCNHFANDIPTRVSAFAYQDPVFDTSDRLYGAIEYPNGVVGIVETTRQAAFAHEMNASGRLGRLRLPIPLSTEHDADIAHDVPRHEDVPERAMHQVQRADPFRCQLSHFADVIDATAKPRVPLAESIIGVFTVEALITSAITEPMPQPTATPVRA